jgi:RNA polymerase sigma-70 factor (ECF subfamily)
MDEKKLKKEFEKIYYQYIDKIYRFIFLKVDSQQTAEDLTSEVFLRYWKVFSNLENQKFDNPGVKIPHISGFLYQTARNLVIDFYREKNRTKIKTLENATKIGQEDVQIRKINQDKELDTIKKTLSLLNDEYQNLIIWHYIEDLPISEIAKITKKSESAIRMQLSRALKTLKNLIEQ